jgi:uncharacterized protein YjlB
MVERARRVPIPAFDPVQGVGGPLTDLWAKADREVK